MPENLKPVVASEQVTADYRRYLRSLLPIRDEVLANALDHKLATSPLLVKGPMLESTPAYLRAGSLADLIDDGTLPTSFRRFDSPALPLDRALYAHQESAARKARAGRNFVVSTGTGSGKTESFLIPILASLADEIAAGSLSPGIRALLLYPMNALANDQMKRLRQVLATTPEVTFGRYIGDTPTQAAEAQRKFEFLNPGEPRLPNELLSREEMQATPPHLLLTNYAMLEYLLLRPADMDLFEGPSAGHWKFLIVDEAHVYDGARGSELAMLLRRLQERVGVTSTLQCIATSATVGADAKPSAVTDFARNLFGAPFEWDEADPKRQDLVRATRVALPKSSWGPLLPSEYEALSTAADVDVELQALAAGRGLPWTNAADVLARERVMNQLRADLAAGSQTLAEICRTMPEGWDPQGLASVVETGGRVADDSGVPLLAARYHLWLRASEGAFTCLDAKSPHVHLARQEVCDTCSRPCYEFGACTRCGTVYVVGTEVHEGRALILRSRLSTQDPPTWLALTSDQAADDEDDDVWEGDVPEVRDAIEVCTSCGGMNPQGSSTCSQCSGSALRSARVVKGHSRTLTGCVSCGSRSRGQVRLLDTGPDASASVLATSLYQNLPPDAGEAGAHPGEGRKLLAFSDSRQGAAFFAPYLDNSYRRLLQRRLLLTGITFACAQDGGSANLADTTADVLVAATRAGLFSQRLSRREKERIVSLWLAQELVAFDDRQSLEGLGMIEFTLERPERMQIPPILSQVGLSDDDAFALMDELLRTVRRQGAITLPEGVDPADEAFAPRLGPIFIRDRVAGARLLGWSPSRGANKRLDYLKRVLDRAGSNADPGEMLEGLWRLISHDPQGWLSKSNERRHGVVWQLDHTWLRVRVLGTGGTRYRCDVCRQIATRSVWQVCPSMRCDGRLKPEVVAPVDADRDHYRRIYQSLLPIPLKVEEHTAQWEATKAAEIQNQFIRGEINALSCSTTFELGVDVGELQAVLLRNVPPATANYVQRAGRAGRRTASAALVLTFAQRRSHDLTRFADPQNMINGIVRAPLIPLGNERIDRRHAHSVALAAFFRDAWLRDAMLWRKVGDFFSPESGQPSAIALLARYLDPVPAGVIASLESVLPPSVQKSIGVATGEWAEYLLDHLKNVQAEVQQEITYFEEARRLAFEENKNSLVAQIGRVLETLRKRDLLGFLGSRNVLPKYGFPVDVVDLRTTNSDNSIGANLDLSRDLSSAIYEYAPGAEVVAGGWVWKSAGVYRLPNKDLVSGWYADCTVCHFFESSFEELADTCPQCAHERKKLRYAVPEFGFLAERSPTKPTGAPPVRSWNGSTHFLEAGSPIETGLEQRRGDGQLWSLEASERATLMALSTGVGHQGFLICGWCGRGVSVGQKVGSSHAHAWKAGECSGPMSRTALAHKYQTDVVAINLEALVPATNDSYWSLLYALLEAAADLLQIARDDIDGTMAFGANSIRLILFDTVPGGAGCVLQIPPRIDDILAHAARRLSHCECGEETSCYSCLRGFRNQIRHDQLSRGSALAMVTSLAAAPRATPGG